MKFPQGLKVLLFLRPPPSPKVQIYHFYSDCPPAEQADFAHCKVFPTFAVLLRKGVYRREGLKRGQAPRASRTQFARMAESVDALVSNTSAARRAGSTPAPGTKKQMSGICFFRNREPGGLYWGETPQTPRPFRLSVFLTPLRADRNTRPGRASDEAFLSKLHLLFLYPGAGGKLLYSSCQKDRLHKSWPRR